MVSEQQFALLIGQTKRQVLKAISLYLSPDLYEYIDDVVQETYLRAWKALQKNQFRGDAQLSTWLYVIARNESRRVNKKLGKKLGARVPLLAELTAEEEDALYLEELEKCIEQLPDKYRALFQMKLRGLSEEEISNRLQISKGTVKSRTNRGKKLLSQLIAEART